jgi:hypothetical protein
VIVTVEAWPKSMAQEAEVFGSLSFLSQLRYRHLVAGVAGGVTATLLTHPFDLIKLRLAVQDGKGTGERTRYRGPIHAFRSILREEGVRQLYRGASANVAGSGTSWGLYFFFYNAMKFSLQEGDIDVSLSALHHLMCAVVAGIYIISPLSFLYSLVYVYTIIFRTTTFWYLTTEKIISEGATVI